MKDQPLAKYHILGKSEAIHGLAEQICLIAPHWETALLTGERGVGKELAARAIHQLGPTKGSNMTALDCAALPSGMAESLLFGHERGAFTGAVKQSFGLLEQAQGGTLFLDEIGTLPIELQRRFLRFLEEGTIKRLGSVKPIHIRCRIIAATNVDLAQAARSGAFLPDLYDRLNVFRVGIPALRERGEDVLLLYDAFMKKDAALHKGQLNQEKKQLLPDAREMLLNHPFPGNVRELKYLCKRISVLCKETMIGSQHIKRYFDPIYRL